MIDGALVPRKVYLKVTAAFDLMGQRGGVESHAVARLREERVVAPAEREPQRLDNLRLVEVESKVEQRGLRRRGLEGVGEIELVCGNPAWLCDGDG